MNDVLRKLDEVVTKELEKMVAKGEMSPSEFKASQEAVCLLKDIRECEAMDAENMNGEPMGNSYRRGRSPMTGQYVSRNAMEPNWSNNGMYPDHMNSYGNGHMNSYGNGYSGHSIKDRMISRLEGMMDEAKTDYERRTVEDFIHRLEAGN